MILPGEEAILIFLLSLTIVLLNFSILTTVSSIQEQVVLENLLLKADRIADYVVKNGFHGINTANAEIYLSGRRYGSSYTGGPCVVVKRYLLIDGELEKLEVRVW